MGLFERYLTVWVALAIVLGVILGLSIPGVFQVIASLEFGNVNLIVAILIWAMVLPMMVQIDWSAMKDVGKKPAGLFLTITVNWLIKPFTMAALGVLFFEYIFAGLVNPQEASEYIAGMILLGVAPCTAMVFVWSQLVKGDPNYTLVQVSINDLIMVVAFAPIAAFLLGVTNITVPWETLVLSTMLYVVFPLVAGVGIRHLLIKKSSDAVSQFVASVKPASILGLILTVVLLFGFQAQTIIDKPMVIGLIAVPLIIQTYGIFFITYWGAKLLKLPHQVAGPACLIGTSNFFELAVAVAISLFGLNSGAALATVVGVLVEVPVMLSLVALVNRWAPHNKNI
jgi:ACR3 family arsenite transporter